MRTIRIKCNNHNGLGDIVAATCAVRDIKNAYTCKDCRLSFVAMKDAKCPVCEKRVKNENEKRPADDQLQYIQNTEKKFDNDRLKLMIKMDTNFPLVWRHNPWVDDFDVEDMVFNIGPGRGTQQSNTSGLHTVNSYRLSLEDNLRYCFPDYDMTIPQGPMYPDLHLSSEERAAPREIGSRYWLLTTYTHPFTSKNWPYARFQELVDSLPEITFVQIGLIEHLHPRVRGDNVIDFVGQTEHPDTGLRRLFQLFYHADGSVGPVSGHMHIAAGIVGKSGHRVPAVVIAGAREPASFEAYNFHRYIHNCGSLSCPGGELLFNIVTEEGGDLVAHLKSRLDEYDLPYGNSIQLEADGEKAWKILTGSLPYKMVLANATPGRQVYNIYPETRSHTALEKSCWRKDITACPNKTMIPLGDQEQWFAKCIQMISVDDVRRAILSYYEGGMLPSLSEVPKQIQAAVPAQIEPPVTMQPVPVQPTQMAAQVRKFPARAALVVELEDGQQVTIPAEVVPEEPEKPIAHVTRKPIAKMVCNAHSWGGGERSSAWIINRLKEIGFEAHLVPSKKRNGAPHVGGEYSQFVAEHDLIVTDNLTEPCDLMVMYCNDMVYGFNEPKYSIFERIQAKRKVMILNYKIGKAADQEWSRGWFKYGFLNNNLRTTFLRKYSAARTFTLPPPVDLTAFLNAPLPVFSGPRHLVKLASQGDNKHPQETNAMIHQIRSVDPDCRFSFMPAPSKLDTTIPNVKHYQKNQIPVVDFLTSGNIFWYPLPYKYTDQGPRVIMEAMACGLPVLADNRDGAADRVIPGQTGMLLNTHDEYATAVGKLTPEVMAKMGAEGRDRAMKFDPENWIKQILDDREFEK